MELNTDWDQMTKKEGSGAGVGSKYEKFADGETRTLTYHGWTKRPQSEKSKADPKFATADGQEFLFEFTRTLDGKDIPWAFSSKSFANAISISMHNAGIMAGDTFEATRHGLTVSDTRYEVVKIDASGNKLVKDEAPF